MNKAQAIKANKNGKREYLWIVVHCSATKRDATTAGAIKAHHMKPVASGGNGWSDVGYHFMIDGKGQLHVGRDSKLMGAGAAGWNEDAIHICLFGDGDHEDLPATHPQYKALKNLAATLAKRYGIPVECIIGHRDVYPMLGQKVAKSCPGEKFYAMLPELRVDVSQYL